MKYLNILGLPEQEDPMANLLSPMRAGYVPPVEVPDVAPTPIKKAALQLVQSAGAAPPMSELEQLQKGSDSLTQKALADQEVGIKTLQDERGKIKGPSEMNPMVAMLMGLSDTVSDNPNKKLPAYLQNQAAQKALYEDKQQKYQENIQRSQNDLSKERIALYGKQIADQKANKTDEEMRQARLELIRTGSDRNRGVSYLNGPGGGREQMFDTTTHDKIVRLVTQDKQLRDRTTQFQNLQNAMTAIDAPDITPSQQVHEFQQAIRKNIGISGSSGVAERNDTYIPSIRMTYANAVQYLSGKPEDVVKTHPELIAHLRDLANVEMDSVSQQKDKRIRTLTSGHKVFYDRRPDLYENLQSVSTAASDQFSANVNHKTTPVVGESKKGYKFLGGDPSKAESWEKN